MTYLFNAGFAPIAVGTVEELSALAYPGGIMYTLNRESGDGLSSVYRWDEDSTETADGVAVVSANGFTTGRWLLVNSNVPQNSGFYGYSAESGGVLTSADGADNLTSLQALLDAGGTVTLNGVGTYDFDSWPVNPAQNATLVLGADVTVTDGDQTLTGPANIPASFWPVTPSGQTLSLRNFLRTAFSRGLELASPPPGWIRRKKITVNPVTATLTNFPVHFAVTDSEILSQCQPGGTDLFFTSSDGTRLAHEIVPRGMHYDTGAWSWWSRPQAVYNATANKTWFGYGNVSGDACIGEIDHDTGTVIRFQLNAGLEYDDHICPTIVIRSDGKLVAFYTKDIGDTSLRYRVSTNAYDASAWATEQTITIASNVVYTNPMILSDGRCYIFYRRANGSGRNFAYRSTADYSTWTSETSFIVDAAQKPYVQVANLGDRIDFVYTDGHPDDLNTSMYHVYAQLVSGSLAFYRTDGTALTLPIAPSAGTLIYNGANARAWGWDVTYGSDGYPRCVFERIVSANNSNYYFARCTSGGWLQSVSIGGYAGSALVTGQPSYLGGVCFDAQNPNVLYVSTEITGVYEMETWTSEDNGATWYKSAQLTGGNTVTTRNIRPYSPRNHNGQVAVIWMGGTYPSPNGYDAYVTWPQFYPQLPFSTHFKAPSISGVSTDFYVYYGAGQIAAQQNPTEVWDSNYLAVYHFSGGQGEGVNLNTVLDSTSNGRFGTKQAINNPSYNATLGTLGLGGEFVPGSSPFVNVFAKVNFAGLAGATIEGVVKWDGGGAANHTIFANLVTATTGSLVININFSTTQLRGFAVQEADTQVGGDFGAATATTTGALNHCAITYDATQATNSVLRGWLNGVVGGTGYGTNGVNLDATAVTQGYIGRAASSATQYFDGTIYEVRISNTARSAAWILASARSLVTPTAFYSLGAAETVAFAGG